MDTVFVKNLTEHPTFYGISTDAIFTTFVTIFIFLLGYVFNRWYDRSKENTRLKEVREFFLTNLRHLLEPMEKQADSLKSLASQIVADTHQDFTLDETSDLYVDPLKSVSQLDVFNALMKGPKNKRQQRAQQFCTVVATLEFIRLLKERTEQHFSDFIQAHRRYLQAWNENVNAIGRQFDALIAFARANNITARDDTFVSGLDSIFHAWSLLPERRYFTVVRDNLLNPIQEHCRTNKDDLRGTMFLPLILNCFNAHDNILHLKSLYSASFKEQGDKLLAKRAGLLDSIKFFSNND